MSSGTKNVFRVKEQKMSSGTKNVFRVKEQKMSSDVSFRKKILILDIYTVPVRNRTGQNGLVVSVGIKQEDIAGSIPTAFFQNFIFYTLFVSTVRILDMYIKKKRCIDKLAGDYSLGPCHLTLTPCVTCRT